MELRKEFLTGKIVELINRIGLTQRIKGVVLSSRGLPLFLSFTLLAVLFVLFGMKNVEMDYKIAKTNRDIEKILLDNKELKAKSARMQATDRLRKLALKHHLDQP